MSEPESDSNLLLIVELLTLYGFESRSYNLKEIVTEWLSKYSDKIVRLAIVEALYLGRYKIVSVEQILQNWLRKRTATIHFSHDFERSICGSPPRNLATCVKSSHKPNVGQLKAIPQNWFSFNPVRSKAQLASRKLANQQAATTVGKNTTSEPSVASSARSQPRQTPTKNSCLYFQHTQSRQSKHSINQFTPSSEASEFYLKLKAVAQQSQETENLKKKDRAIATLGQ